MIGNCTCAHSSPSNRPASDQICLSCKKSNHLADACRSKAQRQKISLSRTSQKSSVKLMSHVGRPILLEMKHFVSIDLNLPQDTHKNILLKDTLATGAWETHPRIQPSLPAAAHRSSTTVPLLYLSSLQRGNHWSILLCHRHPRPSHHRSPDFH